MSQIERSVFRRAIWCSDHMTEPAEATADQSHLFDGCLSIIDSEFWTTIPVRHAYEENMSAHGEFTCKSEYDMVING